MPEVKTPAKGLVAHGVSACAGCGLELAVRVIMSVLGKETVVVIPPGCSALFSGYGRETALMIPGIQGNLENTAAIASGIRAGLEILGKDANVLGLAGDGGTVDIGLQALSGAMERGERILYLCYDNEAYMNTGIQGSGSTTPGAWTSTTPAGKTGHRKDMVAIAAAHRVAYAATASAGYVDDLRRKVERAKVAARRGTAYIHASAPCPTGWGYPPHNTISVARLGVQTRAWNLFEVEDGEVRLTVKTPSRRPLAEYFGAQARFKGIEQETVASLEREADAYYRRLEEGRLI